MTLHTPIKDIPHRGWCGPTAIAALTGVPLSRIHKMIRRCRRGGYRDASGRRIPIKGTYPSEVIKVLKRLGCKVARFKLAEGTIASFCEDTVHAGTFLVCVTGHFVATSKGAICDTFTHGEVVPISVYRKPRWRVQSAWRIEAPAEPRAGAVEPVIRSRPPKPPRDIKAERHAAVLAKIKRWETKKKRAETALKTLRRQRAYYERQSRPVSKSTSSTTSRMPITPDGPYPQPAL